MNFTSHSFLSFFFLGQKTNFYHDPKYCLPILKNHEGDQTYGRSELRKIRKPNNIENETSQKSTFLIF